MHPERKGSPEISQFSVSSRSGSGHVTGREDPGEHRKLQTFRRGQKHLAFPAPQVRCLALYTPERRTPVLLEHRHAHFEEFVARKGPGSFVHRILAAFAHK